MADALGKLESMGLELPSPAGAVANYVPFTRTALPGGSALVHISGQISRIGADTVSGHLGRDLSLEDGVRAARLCALNLLAQMRAAGGGGDALDRVRVLKLGGFVQAVPEADGALVPQIVNGASDLLVEVLGERGRHARAAVSCPVLPLGCAVEIDAVVSFDAVPGAAPGTTPNA